MKPRRAHAFVERDVAGFRWRRALRIDLAAEQTTAGRGVAVCEPAATDPVGAAIPWIHAHPGLAHVAAGARRAAVSAKTRVHERVDAIEQATLESDRADAFVGVHVTTFVVLSALSVGDTASRAVARRVVAVGEPAALDAVRSAVRRIDACASLANVPSRTHRVAVPAVARVGSSVDAFGVAELERRVALEDATVWD